MPITNVYNVERFEPGNGLHIKIQLLCEIMYNIHLFISVGK